MTLKGSYTQKELLKQALVVADPLCCLRRFSMLHCTSVPTPVKTLLSGSVILLICVSLILVHWLSSFVNFTLLVGKSMWHPWFLRDILSVLRWEAKPRAGSGAGCLSCFTFFCIRASGYSCELKLPAQMDLMTVKPIITENKTYLNR